MGSPASTPSSLLEALAESFLERHHRGEPATIEEYMEQHPEVADRIRDLFPMLLLMDRVGSLEAGARARPEEWTVPKLSRLGDYVIRREIGRGGMGIVYEAEQVSLGRRVALKVLPRRSLHDPRQLERFRREAHAAARLCHPNLVGVYAFGSEGGVHYFAMQYVPSRSLDSVIEELRRLRSDGEVQGEEADGDLLTKSPNREAYFRSVAGLLAQAARALAYAHSEGIVHRDVKPSNLLLDAGSNLWVTDFGLAKDASAQSLTESGALLGTMAYMAPERFRGDGGPASDTYGLGLCLYELATLRLAFEAPDRPRLMQKILEAEPVLPRKIDPEVPADLETIIWKAIRKDPAERYLSAAELAEDLERFQRGEPVRARLPSIAYRARHLVRRHRLLTAALLLLLVGLAAGAALWIAEARRPRGPSDLLECDLDRDRRAELIVVSKDSGHVSVIRAGAKGPQGIRSYSVGQKPQPGRLGDLNGDGTADLVIPLLTDRSLSVMLGDGKGGFERGSSILLEEPPYGVACGDWDGDGDTDLAAAGGKRGLWILDNLGGGRFAPAASVEVPPNPNAIAAEDLDGDEAPDLVILHTLQRKVAILTNDGRGAFLPQRLRTVDLERLPYRVAVGDLDGDSRPDLATANLDSSVCVLLNSEGDPFGAVRKVTLPGSTIHIGASDLDRDGDLDLLLVGGEANLYLLENDGKASFEVHRMQCGSRPHALLPFDWDGDGDLDVIVANYPTSDLSILRNDGPWRLIEAGRVPLAP